ncbi:MAG: restriction endonuclease subunit S [Parcubacteria group bacterium]|jgi:type I restriction enzyme S subunit
MKIKTNWQIKNFEDCLEKITYTNKIQRKDFLVSGKFPIISQEAEFINGYWDDESDLFKVKKPVAIFGDHTQVLKYVDFDFVLGADGVKILQPNDFLDSKFFYYFLQSIKLKSLGYARHYRLLKEKEISFPSLSEQHRIVKILDEVFEGVARAKENAEKNLQNSKDLFRSYSQIVFENANGDWVEKKLGEILYIERGGSPRPIQKFLTDDPNGINWIKIGDTKNVDKYIIKTRQKIKLEGLKKSRLVNEGDFILSNSMSFGRPYIMKTTGAIHDGWLVLREKNSNIIDKDYLYNILGSPYVFNQFDKLAAGSTVRNLNITLVSTVKIPLPSVSEQKSIVAKLDALSAETKKLEAIYRQKLADLEELKKSVLKKAFNGEL